jgi:hypothetical protein
MKQSKQLVPMFILIRYQKAVEALSGVQKTSMVASLAEALSKSSVLLFCHGMVRIFGSPPLPTPGKDFLLIVIKLLTYSSSF